MCLKNFKEIKTKKSYHQALVLIIVGFFYFFSNSILTRLLYPLECKGIMPYLVIGDKTYNFIDLNIPHLLVFIIMGAVFKMWAFLFSVLGELLQVIIKHSPFNLMDIVLNVLGSGIGILLTKVRFK